MSNRSASSSETIEEKDGLEKPDHERRRSRGGIGSMRESSRSVKSQAEARTDGHWAVEVGSESEGRRTQGLILDAVVNDGDRGRWKEAINTEACERRERTGKSRQSTDAKGKRGSNAHGTRASFEEQVDLDQAEAAGGEEEGTVAENNEGTSLRR
jgi:hypothetical protein